MTDFDAVVIGAGPAGCTTAAGLARAGWRVALVERAEFPRRKVCGEFLSATSVAVLERIGLGQAWRAAAGPPVRRLALFADGITSTARAPGGTSDGFGRALGRDRLDALLLAKAAASGASVLQPARCETVRRVGDTMIVGLATPTGRETIETRIVVAAHGSWEPGPLPSHLPKQHAPKDYLGFKAYFRDTALADDLMPLLVFPGGYGGLVTADDGRVSLSLCIRRDVLTAIRGAGAGRAADAVHAHLLASCRGVREVLGDAEPDGPWLAAGPIRPGIRPRFRDGILRVGNAAGEAHPIIAEGISMAVQSGWLAVEALGREAPADRAAIEGAAARYSAAWRRQFAARIHAAEAFRLLAAGTGTARIAGSAIRFAPGLLRLGARLAGKTRPLDAGSR